MSRLLVVLACLCAGSAGAQAKSPKGGGGSTVTVGRIYRVAMFGDSITNPNLTQPRISAQVKAKLPWNYIVDNFGVPGDNVSGCSTRWTSDVKNSQSIAARHYDYIVILIGINDINLASSSGATVWSSINNFYSAITGSGLTTRVVPVTLLPFGRSTGWTSTKQTQLDTVNTSLRSYASTNAISYAEGYNNLGDTDTTQLLLAYDSGDGLHPNGTGTDALATYVANAILSTPAPTAGDNALPLFVDTAGYVYTEASGSPLTGSRGQAITVTRSSARTCTKSDGTLVSVGVNSPCLVTRSGNLWLDIGFQLTNLTKQSQTLDSWTASSATVSANTGTAPDGTATGDSVTSTVAGGYVESPSFVISNTKAAVSMWTWTASGTQGGALVLRDVTGSADACTVTFTSTTTPTRQQCVSTTLTSGRTFTVRFYPGAQAGTGTAFGWGAQTEANTLWPSPQYVATTAAAVTLTKDDTEYTSMPVMPSSWCTSLTATADSGNFSDGVGRDWLGLTSVGAGYHVANSAFFMVDSIGRLTLETWDNANTLKQVRTTGSVSGASHTFRACNNAGAISLYVDGVLQAATTTVGTGAGTFGTSPPVLVLGELTPSATGTGPHGLIRDVCVGSPTDCP